MGIHEGHIYKKGKKEGSEFDENCDCLGRKALSTVCALRQQAKNVQLNPVCAEFYG